MSGWRVTLTQFHTHHFHIHTLSRTLSRTTGCLLMVASTVVLLGTSFALNHANEQLKISLTGVFISLDIAVNQVE